MNSAGRLMRILTATALVGCVPAAVCHASDEPELASAIRQKNLARVQLLLSEGAGVDERDEGAQQTPLMRAAQTGDASIAQTLLAHGAAVNAQDDFGHTALMFAAEQGNAELINVLLRNGAKPGLRDRAGETALAFAQQKRHLNAVKRLRLAAAAQPASLLARR